jgi:translation elongation factor EF-Ts
MEVLRPVVRRLAMHVVAAKPAYLDESAVPEEVFMHTLAFNNITLFIVS